jgi:hypothetical protein
LALATPSIANAAILGVGHVHSVAKHDVAVSEDQFSGRGRKRVLGGASKEALRLMPPSEYENQAQSARF